MTSFHPAAADISRGAFDPAWYLRVNPDVAEAGMDPWEHFTRYGFAEGRAAAPLRAFELDHVLWRGFAREAEVALRLLLRGDNPQERAVAGWVLARHAAASGKWQVAHAAIRHYATAPTFAQRVTHPGPWLLAVQAAARVGQPSAAKSLLSAARRALGARERLPAWMSRVFSAGIALSALERELELAALEIAIAQRASDKVLSRRLARLHAKTGCAELTLAPGDAARLDRLIAARPVASVTDGPLVSVVVPAFNASATIGTCLRGLSAQSWRNLEIIVVDDDSTDCTASLVGQASQRDPRIRLLQQTGNGGAYIARNAGLDAARGAFFTVHDADDWSHPQKIEAQARALLDQPGCAATVSHWVRADPDLRMSRWRMEESWIYRNVSSLMIRREEMCAALGYWDRVRANADTEYYHRIRRAFGDAAITEVHPGLPLSFGRTHARALTMSATCHLATQFIGPRRSYMEAAEDWQRRQVAHLPEDAPPARKAAALFLAGTPAPRPFFAPPEIGPADRNPQACRYAQVAASRYVDPRWYLRRHADVLATDVDPVGHYLHHGAGEDRDPGPLFPTAAWRRATGLDAQENPLLSVAAQAEHRPMPPCIPGALADMDAPVAMVFAHAAERQIFGAERSLLLTLERLAAGFNGAAMAPVVVLPSAVNEAYIAAVSARAAAVEILPQVWRHRFRVPPAETVEAIRHLIRSYSAHAVHINTLVLDAPLRAARLEGCPSVVHVRELPPQDAALCTLLGDTPQGLRRALLRAADRFTANAQAVADWLDCPERVALWPNRVDPALCALPFTPQARLRIGMISSNIAKKGIADFCRVAIEVAQLEAAAEIAENQRCIFKLIGPETADLAALMPLPENVTHAGYADSPAAALQQCDLVMVLSHFAESFGRTALEALAAGRPVICYDRGTPPSFIADMISGQIVPPDDVTAAAQAVFRLACARDALAQMSDQARLRAGQLMAGGRAG